jgi:hypothetical protein
MSRRRPRYARFIRKTERDWLALYRPKLAGRNSDGAITVVRLEGVAHAWPAPGAFGWSEKLMSEDEVDVVMRTSPGEPWAPLSDLRICRYDRGSRGATRRPETDDEDNQIVRWRKLGDDEAIVTDLLASGGWTITKTGQSGVPRGRPRTGVAGEPLTARLQLAFPDASPEEIGAAVRRGKHRSPAEAQLVDRLCAFIAASKPAIMRSALAKHLGVAVRTVDNLTRRGHEMTTAERTAIALERTADALERLAERAEGRPTSAEMSAIVDGFIDDALAEGAA